LSLEKKSSRSNTLHCEFGCVSLTGRMADSHHANKEKHSKGSRRRERNYEDFHSHEEFSCSSHHIIIEIFINLHLENICLGIIIIENQKLTFPLSMEKKFLDWEMKVEQLL